MAADSPSPVPKTFPPTTGDDLSKEGTTLQPASHKSKRKRHGNNNSSNESSDSDSSSSDFTPEQIALMKKQRKKLKRQMKQLKTLLSGAGDDEDSISDSTGE
ncbi:hypothetical protein M407DRAFT_32417, partial [Tulasnella calospora MUT 4182]